MIRRGPLPYAIPPHSTNQPIRAPQPHAIELYCLGLSMNAVAKRVGVSAQSMLRWVRDHAHAHCPKPEPARGGTAVVEIDEVWHFVKKVPETLDLDGLRARDRQADRLGVRRPRP